MATPFAALETRINAVAMVKLANATATINGQPVEGMFDAEYQEILGVSATRPTFVASAGALSGVAAGVTLTITCPSVGVASASYVVTEPRQEHGAVRLWLRKG